MYGLCLIILDFKRTRQDTVEMEEYEFDVWLCSRVNVLYYTLCISLVSSVVPLVCLDSRWWHCVNFPMDALFSLLCGKVTGLVVYFWFWIRVIRIPLVALFSGPLFASYSLNDSYFAADYWTSDCYCTICFI